MKTHPCPHRVPTVSRTRLRTRVPVSLSIDTGHGHAPYGPFTDHKVCPRVPDDGRQS